MAPRTFLNFLCMLAALLGGPLFAEQEQELEWYRPSLRIEGDGTPSKAYKEAAGSFGRLNGAWTAVLPLAGTPLDRETLAHYQLLASIGGGAASLEASPLKRRHMIYRGQVGLTAIALTAGRNVYLASARIGFADDDSALQNLSPRFEGAFLGMLQAGAKVTLLYGAAYAYFTGTAAIFPLGGVHWRISNQTALQFLFPAYLRCRHWFSWKWRSDLGFRFSGDRYQLTNEGEFSASKAIALKSGALSLGATVAFAASANLGLKAGAGWVFRRVTFVDGATELFQANVSTAPYVQIGLEWRFGDSMGRLLEDRLPEEPEKSAGPETTSKS